MTDDKKPEDNSTRNAVADKFEAMGEIGSREMTDDKGAGEGVRRAVEEFRERAVKWVRHECIACGGSGYMPGSELESSECEYCGRPIDAIYGLPPEEEAAK